CTAHSKPRSPNPRPPTSTSNNASSTASATPTTSCDPTKPSTTKHPLPAGRLPIAPIPRASLLPLTQATSRSAGSATPDASACTPVRYSSPRLSTESTSASSRLRRTSGTSSTTTPSSGASTNGPRQSPGPLPSERSVSYVPGRFVRDVPAC